MHASFVCKICDANHFDFVDQLCAPMNNTITPTCTTMSVQMHRTQLIGIIGSFVCAIVIDWVTVARYNNKLIIIMVPMKRWTSEVVHGGSLQMHTFRHFMGFNFLRCKIFFKWSNVPSTVYQRKYFRFQLYADLVQFKCQNSHYFKNL